MPDPQKDPEIPGFSKKDIADARAQNEGFIDEDEDTPPQPPTPPAKPKVEAPKAPPAEPPQPPREEREPPARPARYIPIPQYQEEKSAWKQREKELSDEISALKTAAGPAPDTKREDEAIKAFAEEHGVAEKFARDILALARQQIAIPQNILDKLEAVTAKSADEEDKTYFEAEFTRGIVPLIQERYPEASPEAIAKIKTQLDEMSHTRELHRTPLDYIFSRHESDFAEILKPTPGKKGPESSRPGPGRTKVITADAFAPDKDGKYDFSALEELDSEKVNEIVSGLSPFAYDAYINSLAKKERVEGVEISRGGRRIRLK